MHISRPRPTPRVLSAQAEENRIMALNSALVLRKTDALTPYDTKAWERLLLFITISSINTLVFLSKYNWASTLAFVPFTKRSHHRSVSHYLDREFQPGATSTHCLELKNTGLFPDFSPFFFTKARQISHDSYPYSAHIDIHSINYTIDPNVYPCTWGTFSTVCFLVWNLQPGSQTSVRDVSEAYRTIPVHSKQWPGLVKLREDQFAINTFNNFGLASAGGGPEWIACYGNIHFSHQVRTVRTFREKVHSGTRKMVHQTTVAKKLKL